jgi:electron transfer flavoprotein beta subunit
MQIYVCLKHVPDTAANIRPLGGREFDETVKFIMNPYDEYALEQALLIREGGSGAEVVAVTVGKEPASSTLRTALAIGADRAIHVRTETYFTDAVETGRLLYRAISQDGSPDLILTGRQSIDTEAMQVPYRLGALFDIPVVMNVVAFSMAKSLVTVEREIEGDVREVIEMALPCIVGATKGLNRPRCATLPDMMKAKKKGILVLTPGDLGAGPNLPALELLELQPVPDRGRGRMLEGSPDDMAQELLRHLRVNSIL